MRIGRYDPGTERVYELREVAGKGVGRVRLKIERFVGGGFAGQVYRVRVRELLAGSDPIAGIDAGGVYAMKIMIPPSAFSRMFRNLLYGIGFQGPFQLQVNPEAARSGALWQKFIRRGAGIRFGDQGAVVDIHAVFVDPALGSCGELSEWIDGRTWRLEVDDRLDFLNRWRKGKLVEAAQLGSPEYRAKYDFMRRFVVLLHDMGGHEFARQYEWSTCKSQPNCLKRIDTVDDPSKGLTAVDFRAGLALLPFLPMSPGDVKLIFKGISRGSLVQFDRGDVDRLERFVDAHENDFSDMRGMLEDLKASEREYRNSVPDITHHHVRLLFSKKLWSTILGSAATAWRVGNRIDDRFAARLDRNRTLLVLFFLMGLVPFAGATGMRWIGNAAWRDHYRGILTGWDYLKRAFWGKAAEKVIVWHRAGRLDKDHALKTAESGWGFVGHFFLSLLPVSLHRFLTDRVFAKEKLDYIFLRPIRLYFDPAEREAWLRDMVEEGLEKGLLIDDDAGVIISQLKEPFIQKYLKSLAVHVCTLPVTQVVSVLLAVIYVMTHPEMPRAQAWGIGLGIIALFQVTPISPGSLVRGLYVVYLVIRERNFKDYNIAVFLGFFKYIGYLAFPIQMAYRFPVLARFMAGHWANGSVHIVPVFGESGALLEHWVFRLFYNWPLTIRRRIQKRIEQRAVLHVRYWHIGLIALAEAGLFGVADLVHLEMFQALPGLKEIWWLAVTVPVLCGAVVTLGCGGAELWKRIVGAVFCGILTGLFYAAMTAWLSPGSGIDFAKAAIDGVWRAFTFSIFSAMGAIITELKIPDPDLKK
jgi:hypothetical protein